MPRIYENRVRASLHLERSQQQVSGSLDNQTVHAPTCGRRFGAGFCCSPYSLFFISSRGRQRGARPKTAAATTQKSNNKGATRNVRIALNTAQSFECTHRENECRRGHDRGRCYATHRLFFYGVVRSRSIADDAIVWPRGDLLLLFGTVVCCIAPYIKCACAPVYTINTDELFGPTVSGYFASVSLGISARALQWRILAYRRARNSADCGESRRTHLGATSRHFGDASIRLVLP